MSEDETKPTQPETTEVKTYRGYVQIIKANPMYENVSKVLHWTDPLRSGLLFGIFNFFFYLITWGEYSVLTLLSYLFLSILLVCVGYANFVVLYAQLIQKKKVENPLKEKFQNAKCHISKSVANQHAETILEITNLSIDYFREAVYGTNLPQSLKMAGLLYLFATIGNWFSGAALLYLGGLFAFIWPRLYQEKKKEIDQGFEIAKSHINKYIEMGISKIPPNVKSKLGLKPKEN